MMDQSRQSPTKYKLASLDHKSRYEFACEIATGRTLDAACGVGYGTQKLGETVPVVVGIDISFQALDWAEEHFPGPLYIHGDIGEAPWEGKFETIISFETLEHLRDPSQALQAFRRDCVGRFIASVPNENVLAFNPQTFLKDEFPHYRHYTPEQFTELLETHGFKVKQKFSQISKTKCEVLEGTEGRNLVYVCE